MATKKTGAKKTGAKAKAAAGVGRPPKLTMEQKKDAAERVANGATIAELHEMKRFAHVSPATLANAVRSILGERPRGRHAPNAEQRKEIVALYKGKGKDAGVGMKYVAESVGFSVPTVRKVLEEENVEIRSIADYE